MAPRKGKKKAELRDLAEDSYIGCPVKHFWEGDTEWYSGRIMAESSSVLSAPREGQWYIVRYNDGEYHEVNLDSDTEVMLIGRGIYIVKQGGHAPWPATHYELSSAAAATPGRVKTYEDGKCYMIYFQTGQYASLPRDSTKPSGGPILASKMNQDTKDQSGTKKKGQKPTFVVTAYEPDHIMDDPDIKRQLAKGTSKTTASLVTAFELAADELKAWQDQRLAWQLGQPIPKGVIVYNDISKAPPLAVGIDIQDQTQDPKQKKKSKSNDHHHQTEPTLQQHEDTTTTTHTKRGRPANEKLSTARGGKKKASKTQQNLTCAQCNQSNCDEKINAAVCAHCNKAYHLECWGGPPINKPPALTVRKQWFCADCASCDRCGRTQREIGTASRVARPRADAVNKHGDFFHPYTGELVRRETSQAFFVLDPPSRNGADRVTGHLCKDCVHIYRSGKLCPTCHREWTNDNDDAMMLKCDGPGCRLWVHAACENLDAEAYEKVGNGTHPLFGLEYLCAAGCAAKIGTRIVSKLQSYDTLKLFAVPVDASIAPNYHTIVTRPMDLSTMATKAAQGEYKSTQMARNDVELMCANALLFNRPGDRVWKEAVKFLESANALFDSFDFCLDENNNRISVADAEADAEVFNDESTGGSGTRRRATKRAVFDENDDDGSDQGLGFRSVSTFRDPYSRTFKDSSSRRANTPAGPGLPYNERKSRPYRPSPKGSGEVLPPAASIEPAPEATASIEAIVPTVTEDVVMTDAEPEHNAQSSSFVGQTDATPTAEEVPQSTVQDISMSDNQPPDSLLATDTTAKEIRHEKTETIKNDNSISESQPTHASGDVSSGPQTTAASTNAIVLKDSQPMTASELSATADSNGIVPPDRQPTAASEPSAAATTNDIASNGDLPPTTRDVSPTTLVKVKIEEEEEKKKPVLVRRSIVSKYGLTALKMRDDHYAKVQRDKDSRAATVRKDAVAGTAVRHVEKADRVPCNDPVSCITIAEIPLGNRNTATRVAWLDACLVCGTGEAVSSTFGGDGDDTSIRGKYTGPPNGDLLFCVDCGECMHAFCISAPIATMTSEARRTWRCPNCKLCEICGLCKQEDESRLVYCDVCDKGYHLDCIEPPLASAPPSRWICGLCVECRYCDRSDNEEGAKTSKWLDRRTWSSRCDTCFDCLTTSLSRTAPPAIAADRAPLHGRCAALGACLRSGTNQEVKDNSTREALIDFEDESVCPYCGARFHTECGNAYLLTIEASRGQPEHRACARCIAASGTNSGIETHLGNNDAAWRCTVACAQLQRQRRKRRLRKKRLALTGSDSMVDVDDVEDEERILLRPVLRGWTAFFADLAVLKPSKADECRTMCRAIELALGGSWKDPRQCALCKKSGDCAAAGRLISVKDAQANWVHVNCARWSSEVYEIEGGWALNVFKAIQRSKTLKCSWCKVTGATMGCCESTCRTNYHFRCGGHNGAIAIDGGRVICSMCRRRYDFDMLRIEQLESTQPKDMLIEDISSTDDEVITAPSKSNHEENVVPIVAEASETVPSASLEIDTDVEMPFAAAEKSPDTENDESGSIKLETEAESPAESIEEIVNIDESEIIEGHQPLRVKVNISTMKVVRSKDSTADEDAKGVGTRKALSRWKRTKVTVTEGDNVEMIDENVDYEDPFGLEDVVRLSRVDSNFGDVAAKVIIPSALDVATVGSKFDAYDYFVKRRGKAAASRAVNNKSSTNKKASATSKASGSTSKKPAKAKEIKKPASSKSKPKVENGKSNEISEKHATWLDQRVEKSKLLGDTFRLGALVIHDLGKIAPLTFFGFHTTDRIFPLGYRATRIFWSSVTPHIRTVYVCEVLDGAVIEQEEEQEQATRTGTTINQRRLRDVDHYATFRITPLDAPMTKYIGLSPAAAVDKLRKAVEETQNLRIRSKGGSYSSRKYWMSYGLGDDGCGFFGFAAPPVRARIEAMPRSATTAITVKLSEEESALHETFRKKRYDAEPLIDILITHESAMTKKGPRTKSKSGIKPSTKASAKSGHKPTSNKRGSSAVSPQNGVHTDPSRPTKKHAPIASAPQPAADESNAEPQFSISTQPIIAPRVFVRPIAAPHTIAQQNHAHSGASTAQVPVSQAAASAQQSLPTIADAQVPAPQVITPVQQSLSDASTAQDSASRSAALAQQSLPNISTVQVPISQGPALAHQSPPGISTAQVPTSETASGEQQFLSSIDIFQMSQAQVNAAAPKPLSGASVAQVPVSRTTALPQKAQIIFNTQDNQSSNVAAVPVKASQDIAAVQAQAVNGVSPSQLLASHTSLPVKQQSPSGTRTSLSTSPYVTSQETSMAPQQVLPGPSIPQLPIGFPAEQLILPRSDAGRLLTNHHQVALQASQQAAHVPLTGYTSAPIQGSMPQSVMEVQTAVTSHFSTNSQQSDVSLFPPASAVPMHMSVAPQAAMTSATNQLTVTAPVSTAISRKEAPPTPTFFLGNHLFPLQPGFENQIPHASPSGIGLPQFAHLGQNGGGLAIHDEARRHMTSITAAPVPATLSAQLHLSPETPSQFLMLQRMQQIANQHQMHVPQQVLQQHVQQQQIQQQIQQQVQQDMRQQQVQRQIQQQQVLEEVQQQMQQQRQQQQQQQQQQEQEERQQQTQEQMQQQQLQQEMQRQEGQRRQQDASLIAQPAIEERLLSKFILKESARDRLITEVKQQQRPAPPAQTPRYKFCYVQQTESDMLSAQRELALRDAAVRPNPSGCARLEARNIDDAYDRARVTRSLVRAARNLQSNDADGQAKGKNKKNDPKKTEALFDKGRKGALRENREKYKRMKALPMALRLEVRRSHIHGWGLFLKRDIRKDEFIVEYVGQIVRQPVGDKREAYYEAAGVGSCYLFRLDEYRIVDATRRGNVGRFINHCCKPNAYARVVNVTKTQKHIVIIALHDLRAGDEVMYDYKFPIEDEKVPCYCGAPNCKGVMN